MIDQPFTTYTIRNKVGAAIYVGQTKNLDKRMEQHRKAAPWFQAETQIECETFETRIGAKKREAALIRELNPSGNKDVPRLDPENSFHFTDGQDIEDRKLLERLKALRDDARDAYNSEMRRQKAKYEQRRRRAKPPPSKQ